MITGLHHVGLATADPAVAAFHGALAGAVLAGHEAGLLAAINLRLELHQAEAASGPMPALNRPGIRHVCVQDHDCGKLHAAVVAAGGALLAAPVDLGTGNMYAYARDPEGNLLEIEGLPYAPPDQPSWIGHVALVTGDIEASLRFYGALLGTKPAGPRQVGPSSAVDRMGRLDGAILTGAWLPAGNVALEFWQFMHPAYAGTIERAGFAEPGFSHLAFESDDPAQDMARALALGAVLPGAGCAAKPTPGALDARFVTGPDGVLIEFVLMASADLGLGGLFDRNVVARVEAGR